MQRWPRWSKKRGGPLAHAVVATVVPKRRRPPRSCGGGLGGPKVEEAPSPGLNVKQAPAPTRRAARWSQREGGTRAHATGALMTQTRRRPPRPCLGGLGDPNMQEVPAPTWRGPRWSQSEGGSHGHATGASMIQTCKRPPRQQAGGLGGPKAKEAPVPMRRGPR